MSPTRLCSEPRCPNPVRPGASKCDQHEREYERERSRRRRGGLKRGPYNIATTSHQPHELLRSRTLVYVRGVTTPPFRPQR